MDQKNIFSRNQIKKKIFSTGNVVLVLNFAFVPSKAVVPWQVQHRALYMLIVNAKIISWKWCKKCQIIILRHYCQRYTMVEGNRILNAGKYYNARVRGLIALPANNSFRKMWQLPFEFIKRPLKIVYVLSTQVDVVDIKELIIL